MTMSTRMTMRSSSSSSAASAQARRVQRRGGDEVPGRMHRFSWWLCLLVFVLVLSLELGSHEATANSIHRRFYRRAVRLCSRSLSDALYLLCKDRGYNEPFSSSGETEVRHTTGPGLVEECCYNACSIEQMEQYCKPR